MIEETIQMIYFVKERLQMLPMKGHIVDILGLVGHMVSISKTQLYCCSVNAAIGNMQMIGMVAFL